MRVYFTLNRPSIFGARLHIHWSTLVGAGVLFGTLIRQPFHALVAVSSYLGLILLHEAGHAIFARKLGYSAENIYVTFIHGVCEHEHPDTLKDHSIIAWGGVLAQFAVAIPLIILSQTTAFGSFTIVKIVILILGYFSLLVALLNLVPAKGLDGALAWKLLPILVREMRYRSTSKKAAKDFINRLK